MMTFQEYFAEAQRRGWKPKDAAERLLQGIKKPAAQGRVLGVCEVTHQIFPTMEQEREAIKGGAPCGALDRSETARLDFIHSPIPWDTWTEVECIEDSLESYWQDDDRKPSEWIFVNWRSGVAEATYSPLLSSLLDRDDWWSPSDPQVLQVKVKFTSLCIAPNLANDLLSFSDNEMVALILAWPGNDGTDFWDEIKLDPKIGGRTQERVRALWSQHRNPERRRGPRKAAKIIP